MQQGPSSEADSHSAIQEILHLLWKPKVHYRSHNSPSLVPILSQMYPVHTFPPYVPTIHSNIIHLRLGLPSRIFPSYFLTTILYAFLICPMCATFPAISSPCTRSVQISNNLFTYPIFMIHRYGF